MSSADRLRIAVLAYRGNPFSGGQGVYIKNLTRELVGLGHEVEVISGQPYPELDPGVRLTALPSLDLYRADDPFRRPHLGEFRDWIDWVEYLDMCTAGFPEPLTFSLRARRLLLRRAGAFDVIHDNQCLGYGLLDLVRRRIPMLATVHHPVSRDVDFELARAGRGRRLMLRRWYAFRHMQDRVARRVPRILTGTDHTRDDIVARMGVDRGRVAVVPIGVETARFKPLAGVARIPGRFLTTASADIPMKGLMPMLEAFAEVHRRRPDASLVVVGRPRHRSEVPAAMARLGLNGSVRFASGISDEELVQLHAEAEVAVVPSLYEGFSLPAIQAMAAGVPLVATTGGALPEVVGRDGDTVLLARPGDAGDLARAMQRLLDDSALRTAMAARARAWATARYDWRAAAGATVEHYRAVMSGEC